MSRQKIIILFSFVVLLVFLAEIRHVKMVNRSFEPASLVEEFYLGWDDSGLFLLSPQNIPGQGGEGSERNIPALYRPLFFAKIPVNSAPAELLETVNGVGPATAAKIIELREQQGKIHHPEELLVIQGIGHKKLSVLRDQLSFE